MAGLKIYAPFFDASGYGEAARQYALAIHEAGYPVTLSPLEFSAPKPSLGPEEKILRDLVDRSLDYDKVLVHATPDTWRTILQEESGKRVIGLTAWETTKLHPIWVGACNRMDEIWVPSTWNREVFLDCGVQVPVYAFPHVSSGSHASVEPMKIAGVSEDDYVFYSIFHWQERKNPQGLLDAFLSAFSSQSRVALVLKTFVKRPDEDPEEVNNLIRQAKARVNVMRYPKVLPIVGNLSSEAIRSLHARGDCFALLQRAEGWGLPHFEAAGAGNPVLTTGFGGVLDFLDRDSAYLLEYNLRPVTGMQWSPYYAASGRWADPDLDQAVETMRKIVGDPEEGMRRGAAARRRIETTFSREVVGQRIAAHLQLLGD